MFVLLREVPVLSCPCPCAVFTSQCPHVCALVVRDVQMLSCHFQCTHSGALPAFKDRNVSQWWVRLHRVCAPFSLFFGGYVCICQGTLKLPLFLLPTMKDYLDLWCRRAYVPSWLTCLICLCMANSKDVESPRVTHSGHTPLPFYPALLQIACQKWCVGACMCVCTRPWLNWCTAVGSGNQAWLLVSDTCPFNCWHHQASQWWRKIGPYSSAAAAWKPFSSIRLCVIVSCVVFFHI